MVGHGHGAGLAFLPRKLGGQPDKLIEGSVDLSEGR
jgi:hypothetical protein